MIWFRRNWPPFALMVIGLLFVASLLVPIFGLSDKYEHARNRSRCQTNLKEINFSLAQYIQDYDEKLPLAETSAESYVWANAVQPYIKSPQFFQCPSEPTTGQSNPKLTGYTDYFYNAQLQNRETSKIGDVARLIMAGDGNDGRENTDARYAKTAIPAAWRTDSNSPSFRHLGTANYLFVDGHVKAFKVEQISTVWSQSQFYFQPQKP